MASLQISPNPPTALIDGFIAGLLKRTATINKKAVLVKKIGSTKTNKKPYFAFKVSEGDADSVKLQSAGVHDLAVEIHLVEDRKEAERPAPEAKPLGGTTAHEARWLRTLSNLTGKYKNPNDVEGSPDGEPFTLAQMMTFEIPGLHVWFIKDFAFKDGDPQGPDLVSTITFTARAASLIV